MTGVTLTQLAQELGKTKGRISQLVAQGKLEGCYEGEGRNRRFDALAVARKLGRELDPGQLMGNGAGTREAVRRIQQQDGLDFQAPPAGAQPVPDSDADGYQLARTQKAVEEARKLRRQNAQDEGQFVLASEAALQVRKLLAQEIAEFEQVIREGAREISDEFAVDFKTVRKLLLDRWRTHRARRARQLLDQAAAAELSDAEKAEDF